MATATNKMMNATTEDRKLNFMTDHGSTRERVSIAWRLEARRARPLCFTFLFEPRLCQADVTEPATPASPATAPLTAAAAAPVEKPAPESFCTPADGFSGAAVPAAAGEPAEPAESRPGDQSDPE